MKSWILLVMMMMMMMIGFDAYGAIDVERLANAIYIAEGGNKTSHPYGILKHYSNTTARQACINTINHALKDYNGNEEGFIEFLGGRYAPLGAGNDPTNLNRNWVKNVKFWYQK